MEYVIEQRQKDVAIKLLVHYFLRIHKRDDFEKAFENHQDVGNLLSQTDFLTNEILWRLVDGQHIIHTCKVLAQEALQRGGIKINDYICQN
jgi:hypothetical protein